MGDAIISRRGGTPINRTTSPSINFVSKGGFEIVVTFTNNDAAEADVFYGLTSPLTDKVTLATATTSSNITFSGLDQNTQYTISAYAIVIDTTLKKIKSDIVSTTITTDVINFTAATGGTTAEYNHGGKRYKSHTFVSNGTFTVTQVGDATDDRNKVDYLIIAGGGGGGFTAPGKGGSGGGGAGGYRTTNGTSGANSAARDKVLVTATSYGITIGAGGTGATSETTGSNGNASSVAFSSTVSTVGGGGGSPALGVAGLDGGSGGGGGRLRNGGSGTALEGNNGGSSNEFDGGNGGGGANGDGGSTPSQVIGGNGGNGLSNILHNGSPVTRAGGGGGGGFGGSGIGGTGGTGGGGTGAGAFGGTATNGQVNTGSGGGGSSVSGQNTIASGNGAGGIGVIRYEIAPSV